MRIIEMALANGQRTLSEYESKQVLFAYGIPVTKEVLLKNLKGLMNATEQICYPLVLKGCSSDIAHKTEIGLIKLDIRNEAEAVSAFEEIKAHMGTGTSVLVPGDGEGRRELVVGLTRDPQFGPCVMFGLGGIFTEVLKDISFRVAPLEKRDALDMMQEIRGHKILEAVRGMEAADLDMLSDILIKMGQIGLENETVKEIDINPVIISGSRPVAVDALVVLEGRKG
ncbi:MAG: carboxylate--amine ligase [Desulfobacteraceae bacterium]|jgi:acetyl-CoA synthetase (ADP-forming)|nr:MAG: carboxylate--amine ligase [Desulfobacteraceae bacterium]